MPPLEIITSKSSATEIEYMFFQGNATKKKTVAMSIRVGIYLWPSEDSGDIASTMPIAAVEKDSLRMRIGLRASPGSLTPGVFPTNMEQNSVRVRRALVYPSIYGHRI